MSECEHSRSLLPMAAGFAGVGWVALFLMDRFGVPGGMPCHAALTLPFAGIPPGGGGAAWGILFLGGWMTMTVAMMVPTILPFVRLIRKVAHSRRGEQSLFACLILGYLTVWLVFGLLMLAAAGLLAPAIGSLIQPWATRRVLASALFVIAAIFQFLPMKRRCLERCRSLMRLSDDDWPGRRLMRNSFRLGVRHGIACVGSCGTLMMLMFAIQSAHLVWMLVLAVVMAAEKNSAWGLKLARPLGLALLVCAAFILIFTGSSIA